MTRPASADGQPSITINGRRIGPGQPTYVIAEMSANHNQDYGHAVEILKAARAAGADAVKLQTYTADTLTLRCDNQYFRVGKGTLWEGRTLHDLYEEAHTPWDWQPKLKKIADELGMHLFSSPFDDTAVDFLESMQVPAYKIASFEIVDLPLISKVAEHAQADDHVDGHGVAGGDRRGRQHGARSRLPGDRSAQVHQRLPGAAGGDEPAHDRSPGGGLRRAGRPLGPHAGHGGPGGGGGPRRLHRREALHALAQGAGARQRVFARARRAQAR